MLSHARVLTVRYIFLGGNSNIWKMPQFLDNFAGTIAKYSAGFANRVLSLSENISAKMGYERKIVIGEHKIYVRYKSKGHTGKYSGRSDFYANGELYLKGFANPIEISPKEESAKGEIDLVSSQKYQNAIQNKIITQALNTPTDEYTLAEKLLMALVGLVGMAIAAGAFIFVM